MAEGPANITPAIEEGIKGFDVKHPEVEEADPVDREMVWRTELGTRADRGREEIKATQNIGITTEVSGSWDNIYEIYKTACDRIMEEVPDMTLMGGHSSHAVYQWNEHVFRILLQYCRLRSGRRDQQISMTESTDYLRAGYQIRRIHRSSSWTWKGKSKICNRGAWIFLLYAEDS